MPESGSVSPNATENDKLTQIARQHAVYIKFLEQVRIESQRERSIETKRMLHVFFWCFLLPALLSIISLVFVKTGIFPRSMRNSISWIPLVFPVLYSIFFLSSQVLRDVPSAFRRGKLASHLGEAAKDGQWRERVCRELLRNVSMNHEDWIWVVTSFHIDLEALLHRTRYLTALAGAVFFLIMQGIDLIADPIPTDTYVKDPTFGWVQVSSSDPLQFVGLALFLLLLYLSGSQSYHALKRYLSCARLLAEKDVNTPF